MHVAARRTARYLILLFVALAACVGSSARAGGEADARLLVKLRAGNSPDVTRGLLSSLGAQQTGALSHLNIDIVSVPSDRRQAALDALRKSPLVEYAEPDAIMQPQELLSNDPSFPARYAVAGGAWGWTKTHTTQAWDITRGNPSIVVAILDTGLRPAGLDDFTGQVVAGWNVVKGSSDVTSGAGVHGTYDAGTVALALGNDVGNAGYCPGCRIMPVQFVDARKRGQLRPLERDGRHCGSRQFRLRLSDLPRGDAGCSRRRIDGSSRCEGTRLQLRIVGEARGARRQ